ATRVPRPFRIDDGDRPLLAEPKAIGLRPRDPAPFGELQFGEPLLEVFPGGEPDLFLAALRLRLIAAEKDVPPCGRQSELRRDLLEALAAFVGAHDFFSSAFLPPTFL